MPQTLIPVIGMSLPCHLSQILPCLPEIIYLMNLCLHVRLAFEWFKKRIIIQLLIINLQSNPRRWKRKSLTTELGQIQLLRQISGSGNLSETHRCDKITDEIPLIRQSGIHKEGLEVITIEGWPLKAKEDHFWADGVVGKIWSWQLVEADELIGFECIC